MKSKRMAVAIVIDENDKVLMGKRNDNGKWTNPGGHLEKGEDPFEGVMRELKEETGLDAIDAKLVRAGLKGDKLVYIFDVKVDKNQKIDVSGDPDKECDNWTYEDYFDHIKELHVPVESNWGLEYWVKRNKQ
jgi:8-oxo-dGTP pyrophosphatase MutT (NUDIX family)